VEADGPRLPSLARGAAATTLAAALSRLTGAVRVVVVAAALGTTFLANTYQTANTAPNIVFELVAAGVLTSIFVPTFVEHIVRGERAQGWRAADALTSVALVGLSALALLLALAAPLVMRVLTVGVTDPALREHEVRLGTELLRLFAPQVIFYGAAMIMNGALQAHRRFVPSAIAPIFNNVVVIAVYAFYAALRGARPPEVGEVSAAETLLLGAGTTAGVVAMTASLVPHLRRLGWRFCFRFDLGHPAVRKGARLGVWALGYAGGYQAGLVVVLVLANRIEGGVAAYQWAWTFFYLPHALFSMPIFNVLFTAMAEHAARAERAALVGRLRDGLAMLLFILAPIAAGMAVNGEAIARLTLQYGVMTGAGAELVGRVLAAFALGLPGYSAFVVFTRAFYALGETRLPALVNAATVALSSALGAALFVGLPGPGAVAGLALGHSVAFSAGAVALAGLLARRTGRVLDPGLARSAARSLGAAALAGAVMLLVGLLLPPAGRLESLLALAASSLAGAAVYTGAQAALRSAELGRLVRLLRGAA
jgi:putative peptidoglycan lipid II flippase